VRWQFIHQPGVPHLCQRLASRAITTKNLDFTLRLWLSNQPMTILNLSAQQLRKAAKIKDQIAALEKKLARILGVSAQANPAPNKRRKMSKAARAKIAAAQRTRWAKQRGANVPKAAAKPRRKVSAAARKRLAQVAKARWAKAKAAGKKTL
jgi:hypothetical protein